MANVETVKLLCQLYQDQLDLEEDRVFPHNAKWNLKQDQGIYIAVNMMNATPYGVNVRTQENTDNNSLEEVQSMNERQMISVNILSKDRSAALRCHELIFAMNSIQCQQLQETYSFRVADLPTSFTDVSHIEGPTRLNRYALTFNILRSYERTRTIEWYDTFTIPPTLLTNQ